MESTPYLYPPLERDEITRTLRLCGADHLRDPIDLQLFHVSVSELDKGGYEALSYAWGEHPVSVPVRCNGKTLLITPSLEQALRRLRPAKESTRELWIDQICINQNDDIERGEQVKSMGNIFSKAKGVVIWLGEEADNSTEAIHFAEQLGAALSTCTEAGNKQEFRKFALDLPRIVPGTDYVVPASGDSKWEGLSKLLSRRWFSRTWVVQEVLKNTHIHVQCEDTVTDWSTFKRLVHEISEHPGAYNVFMALHSGCSALECRGFDMIEQLTNYDTDQSSLSGPLSSTDGMPLDKLVQMFWLLGAKDPRDHIYALLSLATSKDREEIQPDYTVSYQQLYTNYALMTIRRYQDLRILDMVLKTQNSHKDLPSWVPDLQVYSQYTPNTGDHLDLPPPECICKFTVGGKPVYTVDTEKNHLSVKGRIIAELSSDIIAFPMSPMSPRSEEPEEAYSFTYKVLEFFTKARDYSYRYRSKDEDAEEAMSRTLLQDAIPIVKQSVDGLSDNDVPAVLKAFIIAEGYLNRFLALLTRRKPHPSLGPCHFDAIASRVPWIRKWLLKKLARKADVERPSVLAPAIGFLAHRSIASCTNGLMAKLPNQALKGDCVAILHGLPDAYLLRPNGNHWTFMGKCSLYGLEEPPGAELLEAQDDLVLV